MMVPLGNFCGHFSVRSVLTPVDSVTNCVSRMQAGPGLSDLGIIDLSLIPLCDFLCFFVANHSAVCASRRGFEQDMRSYPSGEKVG